ncbi:MAG: hypothetical protein AB1814_01880 [Thermodesulfobacteriota bacterium]
MTEKDKSGRQKEVNKRGTPASSGTGAVKKEKYIPPTDVKGKVIKKKEK